MIIELHHIAGQDLINLKDWVMEHSPDSELLIGVISGGFFSGNWSETSWGVVTKTVIVQNTFFTWAVDIPDKDAVLFKLVWG